MYNPQSLSPILILNPNRQSQSPIINPNPHSRSRILSGKKSQRCCFSFVPGSKFRSEFPPINLCQHQRAIDPPTTITEYLLWDMGHSGHTPSNLYHKIQTPFGVKWSEFIPQKNLTAVVSVLSFVCYIETFAKYSLNFSFSWASNFS